MRKKHDPRGRVALQVSAVCGEIAARHPSKSEKFGCFLRGPDTRELAVMGVPKRGLPKVWIVRAGAAFALALTFGYLPYRLYTRSGFARYLELNADLSEMRRGNDALQSEISRLSREASALRDDPRAVERVARHELGWVRPGDIILDLSEGVH
jgi:cell division protein FtsB